jgi:DNA-binding SARP family transcriptional activator
VPLGQPRPREELATLLWGDVDDSDARNSLRQTLFLIRRALPDGGADYLEVGRDTVALSSTTVRTDVARFERRLAADAPDALESGVELYRGDFLQGFALDEAGFEEWMTAERERLRGLVRGALSRVLARHADAGDVARALEVGRRVLALDPLDEPAHRALMRLHARQGHHAAALQQYQLCVSVLERELEVEPDAETRELYRTLVRERAAQRVPEIALGERDPVETALIGRDVERRRLEDALAGAAPDVVAILGDAGIGKTRLARELAAMATAAGRQVIVGRCHEAAGIQPFWPWVEALRGAGLVADRAALAELAPAWRAELARLFPELSRDAPASVDTENVLQLFEALARLILDAATRAPLAIVLEDLQWADEMTLRFLSFLVHRSDDRPILTVLTAREDEAEHVPLLGRIVRELDREDRLLRLPLAPLGRPASDALVAALAPSATGHAALAERVWNVSEGNPLVAVEMIHAARSLGGGLPDLPRRVHDLIASRLDRLGGDAAAMAALASVIGGVFDFALLVRAAGTDDTKAAASVEDLVRRRVLHAVADGFTFIHERVREVTYRRLDAAHRVRLHRTVADALVTAGDLALSHAAIGSHYHAGEAWEPAVAHLREAGLAAYRRGGCREAATCLRRALDAHARLPHTDDWKRAAIELRFDLRHAVVPILELADLGEVLGECERLATALDDQPRLARTWAFLGHYHWWFGRHDRAIDCCRRALAVASAMGDPALQISTNMYLGLAFHAQGSYRAAGRIFRALVRSQGSGVTRERVGVAIVGVSSRAYLAMVLAELGELEEGAALAAEAVRLATPMRHPFALAHAYIGTASVALAAGDNDRAIRVFEWYAAELASMGAGEVWPLADWYAGLAYVRAGRIGEGLALLELIRDPADGVTGGLSRSMVGVWLAEAYLAADRPAEALTFAESARALAHEHGERGYEAAALLVLADITARTQAGAASEHYTAARKIAEELGMRPLAARCARAEAALVGR